MTDNPATDGSRNDGVSVEDNTFASVSAFPGANALLKELAGSEFPVSTDVIERLRGVYDHLAGVSPDDPEFERYLREDVIEHETFDRADAIDISDSVLDVSARHKNDLALLPAFFIAFEWFHRCEFDAERRLRYWGRFVPLMNVCLGEFSLYQYALSMYHLYGGDETRAEQAARQALDIAPDHIGFLNTYTEQILERVERELISSGRQMPEDDDIAALNGLLSAFDKRPREGWHPIFHVSYGRILACLGRYGEAQREFSQAVDIENARYNAWRESRGGDDGSAGDGGSAGGRTIKESTYVTEMNEIFDARNTCNMLSNMRSLSSVIDDAQSAQRERARELDDKMDELGRRFDNERIDMLEFIGFFAGIISFVIASIQLGDGLEFPTRALMVLLLMGSLLVAFGAFSTLLESGRAVDPREPKRGRVFGIRAGLAAVIVIGLVVIVAAMLLYLVIR
ncbi:hypothetical protein GFD17_00465 [Bifidobacterium sp. SMB2]|uniref:Tetratricopeptide repeat protein n=1 Tax=Bifidobacterium saimiriisciurei TaxID=2661627 RepID=A0ABX0CEK5_9BIFI|nr:MULTISPECIES: hypothetical protein [Bifidobacterium]NEG95257.1 hypothetical protein [Bifidobacterium sp. SMB2]NEH11334.1 hypothetical protein [Bifidobacterium saimiriisciurei]